jgi:hypothetical protein
MKESGYERAAPNSGRWIEARMSYVDPVRMHCNYCGRPLARHYWQREEDGVQRRYCGPDHAARTTYPKSTAPAATR